MTRLSGVRCAIVTGAGSGMGLEMARRLAARGVDVIGADRNVAALADTVGVTPLELDVTDDGGVAAALAPYADRCDLLVHSAGIGHTGSVLESPVDTYRRLMDVNYLGTVATVRSLAPAMARRGSGHLAIFASMAGLVPAPQHSAYNATKAAVIMFAEVLKMELAPYDVHVTCICPPAVATPLLDDMPAAKRVSTGLMRPMSVAKAADAIERGIEHNCFFVLPGAHSQLMSRLRRHTPRALEFGIRKLMA